MTTQIPDRLLYDGKSFELDDSPGLPAEHPRIVPAPSQPAHALDAYLDMTGTTACRRGFIATWEVAEGQLYLVELQGPRQLLDGPVIADWVSGVLLAPSKPLGRHINIRFDPANLHYLRLQVEAGRVIAKELGKGLAIPQG